MTRSEEFVYELSKSAFLPLWTYPSPLGKDKGKELCDVLIVCEPDIIVTSVKEIELKTDGDRKLQEERWLRRAVEESVDQIGGAERRLQAIDSVMATDGKLGVGLGPPASRRIHRVAVAIGSYGNVPLESRDFGKGFVHVFDGRDFFLLINELDTITDLLEYLRAREALLRTPSVEFTGTEADLVATYLRNNRSIASLQGGPKHISGLWQSFVESPEYQAKGKADASSYVWDWLITKFHDDFAAGNMEFGNDITTVDRMTRVMAKETRFFRRMLGNAFRDFMDDKEIDSRTLTSPSGVAYVFLKQPHSEDREYRKAELVARCYVVRDKMTLANPVIGIATEKREEGSGFSLDGVLLEVTTWTPEMHAYAAEAREKFGFFKAPRRTHRHEDEYPIG